MGIGWAWLARRGALATVLAAGLAFAGASPASAFVWFNANGSVGSAQNDGSNPSPTCVQQFSAYFGGRLYYPSDTPDGSGTIGVSTPDCSQKNDTLINIGATAEAIAVSNSGIYWSDQNGIGRANLDGSGMTESVVPSALAGNASSVAVDAQHIYWPTFYGIGRADLNGANATLNWVSTSTPPAAVSADGQHVYWSISGAIGRVNTDGSGLNPGFITDPNIDFHTDVAVDSQHVYWAESRSNGGSGSVGRANLDGSSPDATFITTPLGIIGGPVAVDSGSADASATSVSCPAQAYEVWIVDSATWNLEPIPFCTVTVSDRGPGSRPPTGPVTVSYPGEDPQLLADSAGSCTLKPVSASTATCTVLEPMSGNYVYEVYFGTHTVNASFGGDTFHLPSSAAPVTTYVQKAPPKYFNLPAKVGKVTAKAGTLTVTLSCPANTWNSCVLNLAVTYTSHHKTFTVGTAHVTLSPGVRRTVHITLTRRHLPRHRTIHLRFVVTQPHAAGHKGPLARLTVTIKLR